MKDLMKKFGWNEPLIPMNAKDATKKLDALMKDDNYVAEIKFDGSRYLSIEGRFFSRKKSENKKDPENLGMPVEKTANVPHLSKLLSVTGLILDGEVFYPGQKSNNVTSIMGAKPEKAIARQKEQGWIQYVIYDILMYKGIDLTSTPWSRRRELLEEAYEEYVVGYERIIHLSQVAEGTANKRDMLKWAEDNGEEGIMLKNVHATYKPDKRPEHHWYKVKGEITIDAVITGFTEGEGKYAGLIGSIEFGLYKSDGVLYSAGTCSGMTDEVRKNLTDNREHYAGSVIEIKAMERTAKGLFRHPVFLRFRDDKSPIDCRWDIEVED